MGSLLRPSPANAFLSHHEQNWVDSCPLEYRPFYYWQYVGYIFVLFKSSDYLKPFPSYLNFCHVNKPFFLETEQNNKISFLDVNVICEQGKFMTSVYRKPTFSSGYNYFDSFSPDTYKIGMIYTLVNRYFLICSSWSMFHQQLVLLRELFWKKWLAKKLYWDVLSCSEAEFSSS